jgi:hypothetical protein
MQDRRACRLHIINATATYLRLHGRLHGRLASRYTYSGYTTLTVRLRGIRLPPLLAHE